MAVFLPHRSENKLRVYGHGQSGTIPRYLSGLVIDGLYRPYKDDEGGGDWYDVFEIQPGRVAVSIGDVMGHGKEAVPLMKQLRETFRALGAQNIDPAIALDQTNKLVGCQDRLVTVVFGYINTATNSFMYSTAGHPPVIRARKNGKTDSLPFDGLPLGVDDSAEFKRFCADFECGDALVLYTDGIIEFTKDTTQGIARLEKAIRENHKAPRANSADFIHDTILRNSKTSDDIAILHISRMENKQAS